MDDIEREYQQDTLSHAESVDDLSADIELENDRTADVWREIADRILLEAGVLLEHEVREFGRPRTGLMAAWTRLTAAVARWLGEQERGYRL